MKLADLTVWKLLDDAAVAGIIADRLYPLADRDGVFPQVQYEVGPVTDALRLHSGRSNVVRGSVKLYLLTETYQQSDELLQAVIDCLDRQYGTWGGTAIEETNVLNCTMQDDLAEQAITDPETDQVRYIEKSVSFELTYQE